MPFGCLQRNLIYHTQVWSGTSKTNVIHLLHFVAFFHVASLLSTGVDNEKVGGRHEPLLLDSPVQIKLF